MKTTTVTALSISVLAATLFSDMGAVAVTPQTGEEHTVSTAIKKTTIPHTMTLTASHRSCQKDPALRHTVVEINALAYDISGIKQVKELELQNQYKETITPLFRDRNDVTREKIYGALQKFMRENDSTHFKFQVAIVDFLPVSKNNDPCAASPSLSP